MNECLVREEQDGSSNRVPPGGSRSVLDVTCFSHKACLCTRSAYREGIVGKLRSVLVRLGHLMQSGKNTDDYDRALAAETSHTFRYRLVLAMPPEAVEWFAAASGLMKATRGSLDLTQQEEDEILEYFNGPWDDDDNIWHYCLPHCRFDCRRTRGGSLKTALCLVPLIASNGFPVPLEYRWKHMEEANCKFARLRGCHKIGPRSLRRLWTSAKDKGLSIWRSRWSKLAKS